jgi:hypothetical protein
MSMLMLMPWCRIDKPYQVGDIRILRFERHKPLGDLDHTAQCRVNTIMGTYKTLQGHAVETAALVRYAQKCVLSDFTDEEVEVARDLVMLACFSALAGREYFNPLGAYCNSDCFTLYLQKFDEADSIALSTRRREGRTLSGWSIDKVAITIPTHVDTVPQVVLDVALLEALLRLRSKGKNNWGRWQNAISCFNSANTDSDTVSYQMEWVLLCSAFEHLLHARPKAIDVASKFSGVMQPFQSVMAKNSTRGPSAWSNSGKALRHEWMKEFYRIRGDFAHGRLATQKPVVWNHLEHLVLATIAFPLVVKNLLAKETMYNLADDDTIATDCFEKLADTPHFLRPPVGSSGSLDSHWGRLCHARQSELATEELRRALEEGLK